VLEVRRRLADTSDHPAAAKRSRPRFERACEHGRSPREALTARTAGYPTYFKASPTLLGFPAAGYFTVRGLAVGRFEERSATAGVIVRGVLGGWIRVSRLNDIAGTQALEQLRLDLRQEEARRAGIVLDIALALCRRERVRRPL
jgi:hypothetical protein